MADSDTEIEILLSCSEHEEEEEEEAAAEAETEIETEAESLSKRQHSRFSHENGSQNDRPKDFQFQISSSSSSSEEDDEEYHLDDEKLLQISSEAKEDEEEEEEEAGPEGISRKPIHIPGIAQLHRELNHCLSGIVSREFELRKKSANDFRRILKGDDGARLLQHYVKASPGLLELHEAWKTSIRKEGAVPIFSLIAFILGHSAGKFEENDDEFSMKDADEQKLMLHTKIRLDKLARSIIQKNMKDVYSQLHSRNNKRANVALVLLAAIVRRGESLASEVANSFDFSLKVLPKMAQPKVNVKRKRKESLENEKKRGSATRRGFVEFAMAFLEVSSQSLLRWVLQIRPLFAGLLRGLQGDDEGTIVRVLSVLQEKVVGPKSLVPTGIRSAVFGDLALEQLSFISANSLLNVAARLAHETLMLVCTDPVNGLLPEFPAKWDVSGSNTGLLKGNPERLLRLMRKLKPVAVDYHRELLLAIVKGRPSLAAPYLAKFPFSLEPRDAPAWFRAVFLLCDLISTSNIAPTFSTKKSELSSLTNFELRCRIDCILPQCFSRIVINRGLLHSNMLVKHASLRLLIEALRSLDCLLKGITAELEELENLHALDSVSHMSGKSFLQSGTHQDSREADSLGCAYVLKNTNHSNWAVDYISSDAGDSSPMKDKLISLIYDIQDQIRSLMPDPEVLKTVLSNLKSAKIENGGMQTKNEDPQKQRNKSSQKSKNRRIESDSADEDIQVFVSNAAAPKAKKKKVESDLDNQDIQAFVTGIQSEKESSSTIASDIFYTDQCSGSSDSDEDVVTVREIWDDISCDNVSLTDECILYAKTLDALSLYQRTLPVALVESHFDAFKYLPKEPLLLSILQQKSILSLLLECTGDMESTSVINRKFYYNSGDWYKYLEPILNLMLYSPERNARKYAQILAYRAMLSTNAFNRNRGEIELWFSFLPGYSNTKDLTISSKVKYCTKNSESVIYGPFTSSVISFLCKAVESVGKNVYKYLNKLQDLISNYPSKEGMSPPCFSPLVVCVLENCLQILKSASQNLKLAQKTIISLYVVSVMKFLLACQIDTKVLAFLVHNFLSVELQNVPRHCSYNSFQCETSPLRILCAHTESILSNDQDLCTFEKITYQEMEFVHGKSFQSLSQVLESVINIDECRGSSVAIALTSAVVCAEPEDILKNFPELLTVYHACYEKDFSLLLPLCSVQEDFFERIVDTWHDIVFSGVELAAQYTLANRDAAYQINNQSDSHGHCVNHLSSLAVKFQAAGNTSSHVSTIDRFPKESLEAAVAAFLHSQPFFVLFRFFAGSNQTRLLQNVAARRILEEKICEIPAYGYVNALNLVMLWILQIGSSWKECAHFKEQLETCFCLLKCLLLHIQKQFWVDSSQCEPDVGLDISLMEEIVQAVAFHPVMDMFLSKWVHMLPETDINLDFSAHRRKKKLKKMEGKDASARLETFMYASQTNIYPIDANILSILKILLEIAVSETDVKVSQVSKKFILFGKMIADSCKPFICKAIVAFKNGLLEGVKSDSLEMQACPSFYVLSQLVQFVSPNYLIELSNWLFSNAELKKTNLYAHIGLFFVKSAFEMIFACVMGSEQSHFMQELFWDFDVQRADVSLLRNVYCKVIEVAMFLPSEMADLCLLSILKTTHLKGLRVLPCKLGFSKILSQLVSFTPAEYVIHCLSNIDPIKAKILLILTEIGDSHLNVSGLTSGSLGLPVPKMSQFGCNFEVGETNSDDIELLGRFALLIPITLKFIVSAKRSGLDLSKIQEYCLHILDKSFKEWSAHGFPKIFDITEGDENLWRNTDDLSYHFGNTLLGKAVFMFQICSTPVQMSRRRRKKLLLSVISEPSTVQNNEISDLNDCSFQNLLNIANRIYAKILLAKWLIFPKVVCSSALSEMSVSQSEDIDYDFLDPSDYACFINFLTQILGKLFQQISTPFQKLAAIQLCRTTVLNFLEKSLSNCLVDVASQLQVCAVEETYFDSLQVFKKSVFLYRLDDCTALKTLRCLLLVLLREHSNTNAMKIFAIDTLKALMDISQFVSTVLWMGLSCTQTFDGPDKGTMFKSLISMVNLSVDPSLHQDGNQDNDHSNRKGNLTIQTREYFVHEERKLEAVKLLRVLYYLRSLSKDECESKETSVTITKLFSLLLSGYGASMVASDVEIFSLLSEIELFEASSLLSFSKMNFIWGGGEAAWKGRKDHLEGNLSEYNKFDNESNEEYKKQRFRDHLLINPKLCAEAVLHFPFERKAWDGTMDFSVFSQNSITEIVESRESRCSFHYPRVTCYDPLFMLQFSKYALEARYLESKEFACLGILGLAFVSMSAKEEGMRKLAYDVLGRYTKLLEGEQNFKGKAQLLLLLTYVKNAVVEPWQKLPSLLSIFAAEASCVLMNPTSDFYRPINHLLMRSPAMNLESIPLFNSMFGSGSVRYKQDQLWALCLLVAGLNIDEDVPLYRRNFLFQFLMSFYVSSVADLDAKLLVIQVIKKAIRNQMLAKYLVEKASLFLWLCSAISKYKQTWTASTMTFPYAGLPIVLEMTCDLLARKNIVHWLRKNGFEQLLQIASRLQWFLVNDSSIFGGQTVLFKKAIHIMVTTMQLSNMKKFHETRYCLTFEGLYKVIEFIELEDPDMNSGDMIDLGLNLILSSSPAAFDAIENLTRLLKLGLWTFSSILRTEQGVCSALNTCTKQLNSLMNHEHSGCLMERLLSWLASSVISAMIKTMVKCNGPDCLVKVCKMKNLKSLLEYMKSATPLCNYMEYSECKKDLAQLLLYIYRHVGAACKAPYSILAALGMLLFGAGTDTSDVTVLNPPYSILDILLMEKIPCPEEINLLWRWSFNKPRETPSEKSEAERLDEDRACQKLLLQFSKFVAGLPMLSSSSTLQKSDKHESLSCLKGIEKCNKSTSKVSDILSNPIYS